MDNQIIIGAFRNLSNDNPWKQHCQGNTTDCTFDISIKLENKIFDCFNGLRLLEANKVLFFRDTSPLNTATQGLALADEGFACISRRGGGLYTWKSVKNVMYQDDDIYFYGYDNSLLCFIPISCFTKKVDDYQKGKIGRAIAEFLSQVAESVKQVDPLKAANDELEKLVKEKRIEEAIAFVKSIIMKDDGSRLALWNFKLARLFGLQGESEKAIVACNEGLLNCNNYQMSLFLHCEKAESLANTTALCNLRNEVESASKQSSCPSLRPYNELRGESLIVMRGATTESFPPDKQSMREYASTIFDVWNNRYCTAFIRQPYNERKVLLVVKDYTDLRQDSLCVMRKSDIPSDMSFPIGHPQEGQVYVGHPFIPAKYVPFEEHQLEFIEDKVREFTWLMQCMGATKISISAKNDNEQNGDYSRNQNISGNTSYGIAKASGSYSGNSEGSFAEQISKAISLNQEFKPTKAPFIPEGLVWYQNEPSWQRLVNQRMTGSLMHASESIESRKSNMVNGSELQTIKAEFHSLISLDGEWTNTEESKFQQQENATLTFEIDFAPIESLGNNANQSIECVSSASVKESISADEQEYIDEVKEMLTDGEIGLRERKSLERFASRLGISPERAQELESTLSAPSLTDDEKEYLEEVKLTLEDGEIGTRERKFLDRCASRLGITPERAKEIEGFASK